MREDPRDALVAPLACTFAALPRGARVGTSSLRRAAQLLAARPDLRVVPIRGNVATRLSYATGRLQDGSAREQSERLDAVVLALAGLRRLGLEREVTDTLPIGLCLPAAGQGALALEVRRGSRAEGLCEQLDDADTARCVRAERAVLARLGGSCTVPIGAHAVLETPDGARERRLRLRAVLGGPVSGGAIQLLRAEASGPIDAAVSLGNEVAELLLSQGAAELLAALPDAQGLPAPKRS
jgi:hydroxymethylbilane synthase